MFNFCTHYPRQNIFFIFKLQCIQEAKILILISFNQYSNHFLLKMKYNFLKIQDNEHYAFKAIFGLFHILICRILYFSMFDYHENS
jgi:hypothetical protein